jgi:hypothetical protein
MVNFHIVIEFLKLEDALMSILAWHIGHKEVLSVRTNLFIIDDSDSL